VTAVVGEDVHGPIFTHVVHQATRRVIDIAAPLVA
jgi:hypothetical protein